MRAGQLYVPCAAVDQTLTLNPSPGTIFTRRSMRYRADRIIDNVLRDALTVKEKCVYDHTYPEMASVLSFEPDCLTLRFTLGTKVTGGHRLGVA